MSYLLRLIIAIMTKNIHRTILTALEETAAAFPSGPHLESLVSLPIQLILSLVGPDQCGNRFQFLSSLRPFLWQNMQLLYCPEFYNMGFNRQDQTDKESQFPKPLMSPPATPCPVQITSALTSLPSTQEYLLSSPLMPLMPVETRAEFPKPRGLHLESAWLSLHLLEPLLMWP